jgi:type II secretory pathway component PulK
MNAEPKQAVVPSSPASPPVGPGETTAQAKRNGGERRGVVLIAVLIVVASLSLAGYHYSDSMLSEYKASDNAHKSAQARKFAESGVHYAAGLLSNPDNYASLLAGNPWNNPGAFSAQQINGSDGTPLGYFSIIGPPDIDDMGNVGTPYFGVSDESSKINLNALMKADPTGKLAHDILVNLPNMTEDIANSIVAWMGGTVGIQNGGTVDYSPNYRCKYGPIDSIDELLLVRGVTRDLLYGCDVNRNGTQDGTENGPNGFDRGWSAYLTVHSREQNFDPTGLPFVFLNNTDMTALSAGLADGLSGDMVKFIIMARQYAPSNAAGQSQGLLGSITAALGMGGSNNPAGTTVPGDLSSYQVDLTKKASYQFNSAFDLIGKQISIQKVDPNNPKKIITTIYSSPLNDPAVQADQLPKLLALTTTTDPTKSSEIPARINVNTASRAVLSAIPGLSSTDVDTIMNTRPSRSATDAPQDIFNTPAWLLTQAQLSPTTLSALEPYITARSQVYRIQSVGYFGDKGPAVRIDAVIDTNSGRPRILAWRDLSELGKGWNEYVPTTSP